jgi:cephalosporin hydroxylase
MKKKAEVTEWDERYRSLRKRIAERQKRNSKKVKELEEKVKEFEESQSGSADDRPSGWGVLNKTQVDQITGKELEQKPSTPEATKDKVGGHEVFKETDFNKTLTYFHWIYYHGHSLTVGTANIGNPMTTAKWMGLTTGKCPLDMWVVQEILFETRPDLIIEVGTSAGGSALFMAQMCEVMGTGNVVTIDINQPVHLRRHDRLTYVKGDVLDHDTRNLVAKIVDSVPVKPPRVMLILDDDHHEEHVTKELEMYCDLVSPGCYLIVEDTNINGHPVFPEFGPGPAEALVPFLEKHKEFAPDYSRQKFLMSCHPGGYLRRL